MQNEDEQETKTIRELAAELATGETTARQLVENCLERIGDPGGEGARAFVHLDAEQARVTADAVDRVRSDGDGRTLPPFAGIPMAVKDLCDVAGQVTTAGTVALADQAPAERDATVVARLRRAGFIPVGRTNMTEFAFSGLGLNPHYGTPRSPWDRTTGRIPGGSSSGTAVAVADRMAVAGLGTDTGGSCRIPAAFCGVTGYKPTAQRVPLEGIVPLAKSLDSVGPLAPSVDCCQIVDDVFAGGDGEIDTSARPPQRLRLAAISNYVLDDLDPEVAATYERTLAQLADGGANITEVEFPELGELPDLARGGGLVVAEAYAWHRPLLADGATADRYDQRVRQRIEAGARISAADLLDMIDGRRRLIAAAAERLAGFDAYVLPTVAVIPPAVAALEADDDLYRSTNLLCLRNTSVGNFVDACAISLPAHTPGEAPVGVMLMAGPGGDRQLFSVARTVESIL